jgi:hypothetical protein
MGRANLPETEIKDLVGKHIQIHLCHDVSITGWLRNIYTEYLILDLEKNWPRSNYQKDLLYIMREHVLFVKEIK